MQGINKCSKYLQYEVGNIRGVVNTNSVNSNLYLNIPLCSLTSKINLDLNLNYVLSEFNNLSEFGKGFRLNLYNRIIKKDNALVVTKADNSTEEYIFTEIDAQDKNIYKNNYTFVTIYEDDSEYTIQTKDYVLITFNKEQYYPKQIKYLNGDTISITFINDNYINTISNSYDDEKIVFKYNENLILDSIHIEKEGTAYLTIKLYTENNYASWRIQYLNKNSKSLKTSNIELQTEYLQVNDENENLKCWFDANKKIVKVEKDIKRLNYISDVITYSNNKTTVTNKKNNFVNYYFDNKNRINMEISDENEIMVHNYNILNQKTASAGTYKLTKDKINEINIVPNYDFSNTENNFWYPFNKDDSHVIIGDGIPNDDLVVAPITDFPIRDFPSNYVKLDKDPKSGIRQNIKMDINEGDVFDILVWTKGEQSTDYIGGRLELYLSDDGNIDTYQTPYKAINISLQTNWFCSTGFIKADRSYNTFTIRLLKAASDNFYVGPVIVLKKKYKVSEFLYNAYGKLSSYKNEQTVNINYENNNYDLSLSTNDLFMYTSSTSNGDVAVSGNGLGVTQLYEYDNNRNLTQKKVIGNDQYILTKQQLASKGNYSNAFQDTYYDEAGGKTVNIYDRVTQEPFVDIIYNKDNETIKRAQNYVFNEKDNLTTINGGKDLNCDNYTINYDISNSNALNKITTHHNLEYNFTYDNLRLSSLSIKDQPISSYKYLGTNYEGEVGEEYYTQTIKEKQYGQTKFNYEYDDKERLIKSYINDGTKKIQYEYSYDDDHTYYKDHTTGEEKIYTFENDNLAILSTNLDGIKQTIKYDYDKEEKVVSRDYGNFATTTSLVNRSKRVTPNIFLQGYKINKSKNKLKFSCFFNKYFSEDNVTKPNLLLDGYYYDDADLKQYLYLTPVANDISIQKVGMVPTASINGNLQYNLDKNNFPNSDTTIMFWFKPYSTTETIMHINQSSLNINKGSLLYSNSIIGNIEVNKWHFICFNQQGNKINIIVDDENKQELYFYDNRIFTLSFLKTADEANKGEYKLSGLIIGNYSFTNEEITTYYNDFQKYVLNYNYINEEQKTLLVSGQNIYEKNKYIDNVDIIPLNDTLRSLNGKEPKIYNKQNEYFSFDKTLKRYVYTPKGNNLVYDFDFSNMGFLAVKIFCNQSNNKQIIFENKDEANNTIGVYKENNYLYVYTNDSCYETGITITNNTWSTLSFTWLLSNTNSEVGNELVYYLRYNKQYIRGSSYLSYTYKHSLTYIASVKEQYYLDGFLEMLAYKNTFMSTDAIKDFLQVVTVSKGYDELELLKEKNVYLDTNNIINNYYTYSEENNRVIPLITSEQIKTKTYESNYKYIYDEEGNVTKILKDNHEYRGYTYSYDNKLINETISPSINITYAYDENNNISEITKQNIKTSFRYDSYNRLNKILKDGTVTSFTYDNQNFYNISKIISDNNVIELKWEGKNLTEYKKDETIKYYYNDGSLRIKKEKENTNTLYFYDGSHLIKEVTNNKTKEYLYDENMNLLGFIYDSNKYFYERNILGDITKVLDINGNVVIEYQYDGYGNLLNQDEVLSNTIAKENPFLYKGYYYDFETGLYLLTTRYYNPEWGRWLNTDDISNLSPSSINGLNLFAYAANNPVTVNAHTEPIAKEYGVSAVNTIINSGIGGISSSSNPTAPEWLKIGVGAIPDIITGAQYLLAKGIHTKFVYSTNARYYFPKLGDTWCWVGKSGSPLKDFSNLANGSFRQILTGNARAGWGALAKSFGKTAALTGFINLGFNLYENGFDFTDGEMWKDTAIDTAIGLGAYYLAAGTASLIVAGVAMAGIAIPGLIVIGGVVLLSMGFDWLIREVTGYKQ